MLDLAVVGENAQEKMAPSVNILKTPWEAPDSAVSPTTTASKGMFVFILLHMIANLLRRSQCGTATNASKRSASNPSANISKR